MSTKLQLLLELIRDKTFFDKTDKALYIRYIFVLLF